MTGEEQAPVEQAEAQASEWMTAELKDVATGNTFTIAGFDKPVLIAYKVV